MPSSTSFPLSVSEILEAQKGPFKELEIWALLCQCAEALQDIIIKGDIVSTDGFRYMLSPNNLMIRDNGTVIFAEGTESICGTLYSAPEVETGVSQTPLSDTGFEKIFVFSLGRTLQVASEFGLKENELLGISYDLDSLLQAMTKRNATLRIGLMPILEACSMEASENPHQSPHTVTLAKLYKTVISSSGKASSLDSCYGSDQSHKHSRKNGGIRQGRLRRPRQQMRHRRTGRHSSESPPTSRSRSRSRSQSRRNHEETEPVGGKEAGGIFDSAPFSDVASSADLNTSMISTGSEMSDLPLRQTSRNSKVPAYSASDSVQGLLGLRQGSPAYQKYIQLKERQMRLRQARSGQGNSALDDVRSRLMTPTFQSHDPMDRMSDTRSMASLISFTLGTYMPELHDQFGSEAALHYNKESVTDVDSYFDSQSSLLPSSDSSTNAMRAQRDEPVKESSYAKSAPIPQESQAPHQTQQYGRIEKQKGQIDNRDNSDKQPVVIQSSGPQKIPKQREYYGPEFVHKSRKPALKVVIPFQDNAKGPSHVRHVTIVHLTGQKFDVALDPSTTARQLMDTIISHTDLDDFFFFGLTYVCEGEHFFLDADTKIHKVAPDGWKEGPKGHAPVTFTLFVRVKFYPESLTDFRHTSSYHMLYLQLRKDLTEERFVCPTDTLLKLAGLALQVEYGDYDPITMGGQNYFQAEQYFPAKSVRKLGSSYVYGVAAQQHKACTGIASSQAEIEFIKHARNLSEYGIHFHKLAKSKSQANGFIWVGLSQHHLVLAEADGGQSRAIRQSYLWNGLMKISFNKRRFSIQPKVEVAKGKPPKINFYTNSHRKGRYLLQFSTDQHRFQIRMRTRPSNMETLTGDLDVEIAAVPPQTSEIGVGDDVISQDEMMTVSAYVDPLQQPLPVDEDEEEDFEDEKESISLPSTTAEYAPLQYTRVPMLFYPHPPISIPPPAYISPPPYQPPSMLPFLDDPTTSTFPDLNEYSLDASVPQAQVSNQHLERPYLNENILDPSSGPTSLDSALPSDKTGPEAPSHSDPSNAYFPSISDNQVGRHIFKVVLRKNSNQGIGITIVGGETTNSLDLGIFVKSVVPGGPAALSGKIKPGDRLIAIGGHSLEGKQHHEAVALIRDAGRDVELLVSQIKPPGTLRRQNYDHSFEQEEFEKKLRNSMIDRNLDENDSLSETETNDDSIDYSTAAKDAVAMKFLQFDDFVDNDNDKADTLNVSSRSSSNFPTCNSDEEEGDIHLKSPSTPPPPPLPSSPPPPTQTAGKDYDDKIDDSLSEREWQEVSEQMEMIVNESGTKSRPAVYNPNAENDDYTDGNPRRNQGPGKERFNVREHDDINRREMVTPKAKPLTREWLEFDVADGDDFNEYQTSEALEVPLSPTSQISNELPDTVLSEIHGKTVVPPYNHQHAVMRENPVASYSDLQEPGTISPVSKNLPETSASSAKEGVLVTGVERAEMTSPVSSFTRVRDDEATVKFQHSISQEIPETAVRNANYEMSHDAASDRARMRSPVSSFSQAREEFSPMPQSPISKEIPQISFTQAQEKSLASYGFIREESPVAFYSNENNEEDSLTSNSPVHEEIPFTSFGQLREEIPANDVINNGHVVRQEMAINSMSSLVIEDKEETGNNDGLKYPSNPNDDVFDSGRGSNHEDLEDILKKLRADNELALELAATDERIEGDEDDWHDQGLGVSSDFYHTGGLTEEEKGDLQILGDIAALEAEASSSDSDFDTAIKNTVDGGSRKKNLTRRSVHPVSPMLVVEPSHASPLESRSNRDEVVYEVILERKNKNDTFGIVTETVTTSESPNGALFIKELVAHGPAEEGQILKPGDKMLEINGQRVTGLSAGQAHAVLDSPLDFCTIKVSRSVRDDDREGLMSSRDVLQVDRSPAKSQLSGVSPAFPTPPPFAYLPSTNDNDTGLPITNLIPSGPAEKTQPLEDGGISIVPPPPPIKLGQDDTESNNTQSDIDSDVLDQSSRSELETVYKNAEYFLSDDPGLTPRIYEDDDDDDDISALAELNKVIRSQETLQIRPAGKKLFGNFGNESEDDVDSSKIDSKSKSSPTNTSSSNDDESINKSVVTMRQNIENEKDPEKEKNALEGDDNTTKNETTCSEVESVSQYDSQMEGRRPLVDHKRLVPSEGRLPGGVPQESSSCASNPDPDYTMSESDLEKAVDDVANRHEKYGSHVSPDPEVVEVTLSRKDGGGFGFTVAGGIDTGGCYIKQLVAAPAAQTGTLLPGDKILMVNSEDTTRLSHTEAVSLLRKGPDEVTLKLLRYPPGIESQERLMLLKKLASEDHQQEQQKVEESERGRTSTADQHSSLRPSQTLSSPSEAPKAVIRPFGNPSQQQQYVPEDSEIILYRPIRDSLEDDLLYRGEELEVEEEPIIREIRGTRVLQRLKPSLEHGESDDVAEESGTEPYNDVDEDRTKEPVVASGVMRIELVKQPGAGIGISICSTDEESDGHAGVCVKKLQRGGAADRDGRLRAGDRLLQANGVSLVGVDSKEAKSILMDAKDNVILTISRPESEKDLSYEDLKPDYDDDDDIDSLVEDAISVLSNEEKTYRSKESPTEEEHQYPEPDPPLEYDDDVQSENPVLESSLLQDESDESPAVGNDHSSMRKGPRVLPVDVPVRIEEDWLSELPLITKPVTGGGEEVDTTDVLQSLVDIVESGEPMEEFKILRQLKEADSCDAAKLPQNKMKNRYRNILPYDGNRVTLEARPSGEDYVNASYISVSLSGEEDNNIASPMGPVLEYIACQGPLEGTVRDMWALVWQEDTSVVVCLTRTVDGVKCHHYWPRDEGQVMQLDGRLVRCLQSYSLPEFDVYHLLQEDCQTGVCKKVVLLQHTSWPDHGTPDTALPLLKLLQVMHLYERGKRPVIHCSAGIGRTGAFIAIDLALATIENGEQIDMFQIVKNLRSQRHGLIQTTDQYLFCYTACMEALLSLEMQDG